MAKEYLDKAGLTYLWGKIKAFFVKGNARVFVGTCSTAAATTEKAVTCADFTSADLVPGTIISVFFDNTNSGAVGSLKLDVNGTGAKPIKYIYNGSLSNIPGAGYLKTGQMYQFYYDGTNWVVQMIYNTNSDNSYNLYYSNMTAGTNGIKTYSLFMQTSDGTWESCTTTSGTGTSKTKNTKGFIPGKILFANRNSDLASGSNLGNAQAYESHNLIDLRYSGNKGQTLTARKPVYLVGTIGTDGLFYLDNDWFTQTKPTTADGKVYYYLGITYDTYRLTLEAVKPMYKYVNGAFRQVIPNSDTVNGHTVNSDVPANAKFTDTTYTAATAAPGKVASASAQGSSANYARQDHTHGIDLATGDANGQVKIAGTNVSVKGLAALAYKASLAKSDVGLGDVDNTADANKSVSSAATLTTARNIDGVDFNGSGDIIHFGDCSTAAGTAAKTVTCSGFKLVSGAWIAVQFRSTNTAANPTLNVNGTGAKEIWYRTERLSTANLLHIQQMGIYLFVYYLDHYYLVGHMHDIATESEAGLMSAADKQKLTSKAAVSGGTDLSLVTTGEKYNWNNNSASGDITVDSVTITGHASAIGHTNSGDGTKSLVNSTNMTKLADMTTLGAGTWLITVGARFTGNATGTRALQIYLDGSADGPGYESGNVAGSGQFSLNCTTVVQSDSSVDVDIYARQNSGAALSVSYYWKVVRIA